MDSPHRDHSNNNHNTTNNNNNINKNPSFHSNKEGSYLELEGSYQSLKSDISSVPTVIAHKLPTGRRTDNTPEIPTGGEHSERRIGFHGHNHHTCCCLKPVTVAIISSLLVLSMIAVIALIVGNRLGSIRGITTAGNRSCETTGVRNSLLPREQLDPSESGTQVRVQCKSDFQLRDGTTSYLTECKDGTWSKTDPCLPPCPIGFTYFSGNGFAYKQFIGEKTWEEARVACGQSNEGSDLAYPFGMEVQHFYRNSPAFDFSMGMWFGLHQVDGRWQWIDGTEPFFSDTDWCPRQPNGNGDCALLKAECDAGLPATWNDRPCSDKKSWLCQIECIPVGQ